MRSITMKVLLAFLVISMVSIVLIVLSMRWMTEREFRTYLFDQNQNNIVTTLADFYGENGTWSGVEESLLVPMELPPPQGNQGGRWFFTLVDSSSRVVLAGPGDQVGALLSSADIAEGTPIKVNGVTVGTMVVRKPPTLEVHPAEAAFLDRIKQIYLFSGIGVIALAILLAFFLSRTLTRPIRELITATRSVSSGKPVAEVRVRSHDELGELVASFNQMNAELARSTMLRRQMTADIAHELRTPVSIILGHTEAVHDGLLAPSAELFETIREETGRLENLIEDLRTLSRADAGELPIEKHPLAPAKLLGSVRAAQSQRALQKGVSLEVRAASNLPKVTVDSGRMMQVLNNLLDNALRYTPAGGHILLSASIVEKMLEIRIKDSGPGIAKEDLERVFDRFYRSDLSRQRDEGGSGLGLAIAKSIVEKHGGQIWAESEPGEGTAMVIRLPAGD